MSLSLPPSYPDPILSMAALIARDPRPDRLDLGIGVYRDAQGRTPIPAAVKAAERILIEEQATKAYLGSEGDLDFVESLQQAALPSLARFRGIQTVGGTGALRIAAEILAHQPGRRILLGMPSWPNHVPVFTAAGLQIETFPHGLDDEQGTLDIAPMLAAIAACRAGDAVLLHGCCHNPTGIDPSASQWCEIAEAIARAGAIPFLDLAYQGFGEDWAADAAATELVCQAAPEALIAYSCDKNFGLYRDRVGMLLGVASSPPATDELLAHCATLARSAYSMPPDHGAAIVRTILRDRSLTRDWADELELMRRRVIDMRQDLAEAADRAGLALPALRTGKGMFCHLPLAAGAIAELARDYAIYLPPSGRLNLAALQADSVPRLAQALAELRR